MVNSRLMVSMCALLAAATSTSAFNRFSLSDDSEETATSPDQRVTRAKQLAIQNPALHILNDHVISQTFSGANEVVCLPCLLQVLAAAQRLGSDRVRSEIRQALRSEALGRLGEALMEAMEAEPTLTGFLQGYYSSQAVSDNCRQLASAQQARCFSQKRFLMSHGRSVDFAARSTVREINKDVEDATAGKIRRLFSDLRGDTQLVFASALIFSAQWPGKRMTKQGSFLPAGARIRQLETVTMLLEEDYLPIYNDTTDGVVGVSLPYQQGPVRLFVFKTSRDTADIRDWLFQNHLQQLNKATSEYAYVEMPAFDIESKKQSYVDLMEQLGMREMFQGGLGPTERLKIDQLVHKAVIRADEDGTSAAGAAGFSLVPLSANPKPLRVVFDRPFIAVLYHSELDVPLFTTYVSNPTLK